MREFNQSIIVEYRVRRPTITLYTCTFRHLETPKRNRVLRVGALIKQRDIHIRDFCVKMLIFGEAMDGFT